MIRALGLVVVLSVFGLGLLHPGFAAGGSAEAVSQADKAFLQSLKEAISRDRRTWIADRILFPILVRIGGRRRRIATKGEFIAHYAEIVDAKVKSSVENQDPGKLFKNWRGLMTGDGKVWFSPLCSGRACAYYIIGINN